MPDAFYQHLSARDRQYALNLAQEKSLRPTFLLEKDIWIVAVLEILFDASFAGDLIFKGGTSLSKAWCAINRFSEDLDITYDIRAFAPDLVSEAGDEALPPTHSQAKRWTRIIRNRLAEWVSDEARPKVEEELASTGFVSKTHVEGDRLYVYYEPQVEQMGLLRSEVIVEFGARSTGEPCTNIPVVCDIATYLPDLKFPQANPTVMLAERTFWEKATAIHVFCKQKRQRGERQSRHWHDLARLDDAGIASKAIGDRSLALSVACHKAMFFRENDADGERIDYEAAVSGGLQLVPTDDTYICLSKDYDQMSVNGMLDESDSFDALMDHCAAIEKRANDL